MATRTKATPALILVLLLMIVAAAGCAGDNKGDSGETPPPETAAPASASSASSTQPAQEPETNELAFPLKEQISVDFVLGEHPTNGKYPWAEDGHPGFKWLQEQTNIKLNVNHIPQGSIKDRLNLLLSTNDLPDILYGQGAGWSLNDIEKAGDNGLFVNILDDKYRHLIPNYLKLIEENPSLKAQINDGKLYGFYQVNPNAAKFTATLPYRKDLFDKFNLQPETWDELYEALKALKQEFPKSYPFGLANQGDTVSILAYGPASFRSGPSVYYNHDKQEWVYGPSEDNYKLFLEFFAKLYKEKLLHPEFATLSYEQWTQSWVNNEIFFSYWWSATGNWFPVYPSSPNYGRDKEWLEAYRVPSLVKGGPRGWTTNNAPSNVYDPILVSAKSAHIEEILALLDFVSDLDNATSTTYGPRGVEWDIVDGKYRWLSKEIKSPYNPDGTKDEREYYKEKYGSYDGNNNFTVNQDAKVSRELSDALADPDFKQFFDEVDRYVQDGSTQTLPQPVIRLSAADTERQLQLKTVLDTYANEITLKIINGSLPVSEFDRLRTKLEELGAQELIGLYKKGSGF